METFIGQPITSWNGDYGLQLLDDFGYVDKSGKIWLAVKGAYLNGASFPRPLWGRIGSPFIGPFRKASIIHNNYIGTHPSPYCDIAKRRQADEMYYNACLHCGCSVRLASIIYICASLSSWMCKNYSLFEQYYNRPVDDVTWSEGDERITQKFDEIIRDLDEKLAEIPFVDLERYISKKLFSEE